MWLLGTEARKVRPRAAVHKRRLALQALSSHGRIQIVRAVWQQASPGSARFTWEAADCWSSSARPLIATAATFMESGTHGSTPVTDSILVGLNGG